MILVHILLIGLVGANSLALSPIAAAVAIDLGVSGAPAVMSAAAVYGAGVALSALCLAPLTDKFGADVVLRYALMIIATALAASAMAPSLGVLIVVQGVAGIGAGMAIPAIYGMASVVAPKGREAQTLGKVLTGWTLSMIGGVTMSAYITDLFGWRMVYVVLSGSLFLILALLLIWSLPPAPKSGRFTSPIGAFRISGVLPGLFSVGMLGMGFYGAYNYLGAHLVEELGYPVSAGGLLTLSYGLGFAASMLLDPFVDRIGARRALIGLFAGLAVYYVGMAGIVQHYYVLMLSMAGWGAFQHMGLTVTVGRLGMIDPSKRGAILGLNSFVMYLMVFVSTIAYRPLFEAQGLMMCLLVSAALAVAGMGEAILWRRPAPQKLA